MGLAKSAVFLDRDGTIIEDRGYICNFDQVEIFPFAIEAIKIINRNNFMVIVVTNQSSIARGICTEDQVCELHKRLQDYFLTNGARIDAFYYCPFHTEGEVEVYKMNHEDRKPSPGMFLRAKDEWGVDLPNSYMVGDKVTDILAGQQAGCQTVLVRTGFGLEQEREMGNLNIKPAMIGDNLLDVIREIF